MIFNSLSFLIFFLIVLAGYWTMQAFRWRLRGQNTLLLVASYIFYGSWDWIFLGLILFSTLWNYFFSLWIDHTKNEQLRRRQLIVTLIGNFVLLGFFKYFNFFSDQLFLLLKAIGIAHENSNQFIISNLILPVGISFFTFQASAYTIDVYRRRIHAEKNLLDFALFVVYFPQLVAGPIERAENLLTALKKERSIDIELAEKAVWNLLHGLFMKVVIADNLAPLVDGVFGNRAIYLSQPGFVSEFGAGQMLLTGFAFMFQLYCDFAGYSFIALGASQMLGIPLTRNFLQPFFATNPAEFWRRWHTTLVRWFTDYVYRPLGGSRVSKWMNLRNIMIVFLVSGLWHGANWTYIIWGGAGGLSVAAYRLLRSDGDDPGKVAAVAGLILNTLIVSITGLIFRAYDMAQVFAFFQGAMQYWDHTGVNSSAYELSRYAPRVLEVVFPVLLLDGMSRLFKSDDWLVERPLWVRVLVPVTIFFLIVLRGQFGKEVIYFAF
jgi:D-alanyl-lipoteichoic acid acyltransferase DltB (MBOAT superfamily)